MRKNPTIIPSKFVLKSMLAAALPFALCLAGSPLFAENYDSNRGHNWKDFGYSDSEYRDTRSRDSDYSDSRYRDSREMRPSERRSDFRDTRRGDDRDRDSYYDRSDNWSNGYGHPGYRDPEDYNFTRDYAPNYDADHVYEYDAYD